ncbi:hypothetical protein HYU06_02390 [Candidatus Woesearchaeota archaeon]|nr:hypothetical protein [Candidatus Woesearchaeota archaeon]
MRKQGFGGKRSVFVFLIIFLVGWLASSVYSEVASNYSQPKTFEILEAENKPAGSENVKSDYNNEKSSPGDHVKESQIHVLKDKIILDIKDASWARFTDTNSMDPVIDAESNSIELKPKTTEDVKVGDIISYHSEYADGLIIHRVIEVGQDNDGWFVRVKGDNLAKEDPGKIRFSQIEGVVVGVIY